MHIRFFNTYEPVSPTYRDLVPFLAERGYRVTILVSSVEYREGRSPLEEALRHPNVEIKRVGTWGGKPTSGLGKLRIMLAYIWAAVWHSLLGPGVDLNFFLTQPPLFAAWGVVLRTLRGQPYIFQVMDIYPDVAILDGLLKRRSPGARLLTAIADFSLRRADGIIAIGRCMRTRLIERGVTPEKIRFIPNWGAEAVSVNIPRAENALWQELGLTDRFTVIYSGNMGVSHSFDDILAVAAALEERTDIQFLFIGGGVRREQIAAAAQKLDNVYLLPYQPLDRLTESLSLGDVHFISLRAGFEGIVVPSKAYGALAVSRPIIYQGEPAGEIARMIAEEEIGAVIKPGDVEALRTAILDYAGRPALAAAQGERARQLQATTYGRDQALAAYLAGFDALLSGKQIAAAAEEPEEKSGGNPPAVSAGGRTA